MSPTFEMAGIEHEIESHVVFADSKLVRSIQCCDNRGSEQIRKLWFLDKDSKKIGWYNPVRQRIEGVKYHLEEGTELIGVYGVCKKRSFLTTFGFLVR